jgi:polysaccharide deacetylase 2 family uncharacterized protein YibQ
VIFTKKKPVTMLPSKPKAEYQGKIAIILDDWGYNLNNTGIASRIKYPLTISVLPNLPYSNKSATLLHQAGFQIILHLPMEPKAKEESKLEKNTIKTSLAAGQIQDILNEDLRMVPFVVGVSNHMGSKATADLNTMREVFKVLKKRKLFFLDSFVSNDSVAQGVAKQYGIKFIKREIFIDNKSDGAYIRAQLNKLKSEARRKGFAVGIGHDRTNTLNTLKEMMPEIEKEGFKFVFASELAK